MAATNRAESLSSTLRESLFQVFDRKFAALHQEPHDGTWTERYAALLQAADLVGYFGSDEVAL